MSAFPSARAAGLALMRAATACLPDEYRDWSAAMTAEIDHIASDTEALGFAAGCLRAAMRERLGFEARRRSVQATAGMLFGLIFFAHGTLDGSGAWPLLWPTLGGMFAAVLLARTGRPLGRGLRLGLEAGAVVGVLFVLGAVVQVAASAQVALGARLHVIALGAALGLAGTVLGATATASFLRRG